MSVYRDEDISMIYTLTYNNAYNYGVLLQAYALQRVMHEMSGDTVKVINQQLHQERFHGKIGCSKSGLRELYYTVSHFGRYSAFKKAAARMKDFQNNMLFLTDPIYTMKDFQTIAGNADTYVVGSDQVWTSGFTNPPSFFSQFLLEWCPQNAKRYSYAASTGRTDIPEVLHDEIKAALRSFEQVSVREESSRQYFEQRLGIKARKDCDPVFLLTADEWKSLLNPSRVIEEPYVLCFELSCPAYFADLVNTLKETSNDKVVLVSRNYYSSLCGEIDCNDAGPLEFLRLIRDAECVITTSFHGTAFSLLFGKKFYSCLSSNPPERIIDLLKMTFTEDRIVTEHNFAQIDIQKQIDYSKTNNVIEQWRNSSRAYITEIIADRNYGDKKQI